MKDRLDQQINILKRGIATKPKYHDRLKSGAGREPVNPVDPATLRLRLAERDAREAADTRTPAQVWLGDPPADRSALAQGSQQDPTPR